MYVLPVPMIPVVLEPQLVVFPNVYGFKGPFDQDCVVELYVSVEAVLGPLAVLVAPPVITASSLAPKPAPKYLVVRALPPVLHVRGREVDVGEKTANVYVPGSFHARYVYPLSMVTVPP
jgi:hypothetical protein